MNVPTEAIIALLGMNASFLGLLVHLGISIFKSLNNLNTRFSVFEMTTKEKFGSLRHQTGNHHILTTEGHQ